MTAFAIVSYTGNAAKMFMEQSVDANGNPGFYFYDTTSALAYKINTIGTCETPRIVGTKKLITMVKTLAGDNLFYRNGDPSTQTIIHTGGVLGDDTLYIGSRAGGSIFAEMKAYQIAIYDKVFSDETRRTLENTFLTKYGII